MPFSRYLKDDSYLEGLDKSLEREIQLARNVQMRLLNGRIPEFEGGQVLGVSIPARLIGGDYYDFYMLESGKLRIVIGDVMGKGIPAAMLMILTRGLFEVRQGAQKAPGRLLLLLTRLYSRICGHCDLLLLYFVPIGIRKQGF